MYFERADKCASLLLCLLSQLLIISGINEYSFITQPPTELQCNPYLSSDDTDFSPIGLDCSVGVLGKNELPTDIRVVWFRRANGKEKQLCDTEESTVVAASPQAEGHSMLLRSKLLLGQSLGDLPGRYWCQILKIDGSDRSGFLSNESSVLLIQNSPYYHRRKLPNCTSDSIFLGLNFPPVNVEFGTSSSIATNLSCVSTNSTAEGDDAFLISRMLVYIIAPITVTLLVCAFLLLFIALFTMCAVQRRDSRKKNLSTMGLSAAIEIDAAINSDPQTKSNDSPGNETAVVDPPSSGGLVPTPRTSVGQVGLPVHFKHPKETPNKQHIEQEEKHENSQSGGQDPDTDDEEEYYYTHVPPKNDRKAKDVIGKLRGACTGSQVEQDSTSESDGNDGGNLEYRSLDPEAMDPSHTYHSMQSSNVDGPQPTYSEPGVQGRRRKPPLPKGHKPTPPKKVPRRIGGKSKETAPLPFRSVPSVNSDYITPNDRNTHLYQGLSPSQQEYLNLYVTPGSAPK